jgi:hypothetical protein
VAHSALLLIVDATTDHRVATELGYRGRRAIATSELGLARVKDPELLYALQSRRDWILVTGDDSMQDDHRDLVVELQPTIATVDRKMPDGYANTDQWRRDVIHKWAHIMQAQQIGTIYRYNLRGRRLWKSRLPKSLRVVAAMTSDDR